MKTANEILIEKDVYQAPTETLEGRVISSNVDLITEAMEVYADQFKHKWYDLSFIPKKETHQIYFIDDDGDFGTMYVYQNTWIVDAKEAGLVKWSYLPELPVM
jgi:hypothetical protein